jgi:fumarate reductase subunit C
MMGSSGAERSELWLFLLQRLSGLALAPFVLIHLGLMIYAARGGLSAGEILARTQGSLAWGLFYGLFVLLAALHGAIGLGNMMNEALPGRGRLVGLLATLFAVLLVALGWRAVAAVV